jgi:transcription initiation factor TFIIIB Brf1 subunit/transcription initiation factor TFIIB
MIQLASDYVEEFADELGLSDDARAVASELAREADNSAAVNRTPRVVAAGACYNAGLLLSEKRSQGAIAEVADVSEVAIREAHHELWDEFVQSPPESHQSAVDRLLSAFREVVSRD